MHHTHYLVMGQYNSSRARAEKARSDAIDRCLLDDSALYDVLLLGLDASGKSAIATQMRLSHQLGITDEELVTYRQAIYRNTLDSARAIVLAMYEFDLECVNPHNHVNAERVLASPIDSESPLQISPGLAEAIDQLWKDPIIPQVMDRTSEFHLMDNAVYFFTNILRIGSPQYLPTEEDILRAHVKSAGIIETRIQMGKSQIRIIEITRPYLSKRKLFHFLENATSIIFCAALSDYDQRLEDQNRLDQSLVLFESIINSRWFSRTSIVLFLTKMDIFKTKFAKVPLERLFPDYSGGSDINKAAKYILWRFIQTNRARLPIYPHLTDVTTDTVNTPSIILAALKETILRNELNPAQPSLV